MDSLHRRLARLNRRRLRPGGPEDPWDPIEDARLAVEEERWLRSERDAWTDLTAEVPSDPDELLDWLEMLEADGPGQHDPFFDFLARDATLVDVRWFLRQEAAARVPSEELFALAQRGLPLAAQVELTWARWEELGRGDPEQTPDALFGRLADVFGIFDEDDETTMWEAASVGNVMAGLAYNRRWAFHSLGALAATELTAPDRAEQVAYGLLRLGLPNHATRYFAGRAEGAEARWDRWSDVIVTVIDARPDAARWIAEGALMRLEVGRRCVECYRHVLCTAAAA